jgi:predicted Zn-dependent peptidase
MISHHVDTLPSGLKLVTVEAPHLHSAMVAVYVRVGSRHETPDNNGVSHFLEHLFFRGSKGNPNTVRMNARVEAAGGNLNGVTTRDASTFYSPVHPEGVGVALEVLGDMLTRPALTGLAVERRIILEEMLDEIDEHGRDIDIENLSKRALWGHHPMAQKIAGTQDSVRAMTDAKVRAHYQRYYCGGNMVLAVAGPVSHRAVRPQAARAFRHLRAGPMSTETAPPAPPAGPRWKHVHLPEAQIEFRLSFAGVAEDHPDAKVLHLLRRVLDDGLSSRLPYDIVESRGLAYSVGASFETFHDAGLFEIDGACAPENMPALLRQLFRTLGSLKEGKISAEELARAKRRSAMHFGFLQDSPADLAGWYGGNLLFRQPVSIALRTRETNAITRAQLVAVAKKYLVRDQLLLTTVGHRLRRDEVRRALGLTRRSP